MSDILKALEQSQKQFLTRTDGEKPVSPIAPLTRTDTPTPLQTTKDNASKPATSQVTATPQN